MPKLKLTYFDIHGGRGEPAELALSIGGIPFENDRVAPSDWLARKPKYAVRRFARARSGWTDTCPIECHQSLRRQADLYPSDAWQAAALTKKPGASNVCRTVCRKAFSP